MDLLSFLTVGDAFLIIHFILGENSTDAVDGEESVDTDQDDEDEVSEFKEEETGDAVVAVRVVGRGKSNRRRNFVEGDREGVSRSFS